MTWHVETRGVDRIAWCSAGAASPEVKSKQTTGGYKAWGWPPFHHRYSAARTCSV